MRTVTEFTEKPQEVEVKVVGDRASVFIRKDIHSEEREESTAWIATEYDAHVNAKGFEVTDEFIAKVIQADKDAEAKKVRAKRNALLDESDKEVLPDRTGNIEAWAEYRQALRDITKQEGFPYEVTFPAKPKE